jgi:hypothetical protein
MFEKGKYGSKLACAAMALLLAAMILPGCGAPAVQPAKTGGTVQQGITFDMDSYLRDAESFVRDATYLRFESKSNDDLALADANVNNAKDLLARLDSLEANLKAGAVPAIAKVTFGGRTFILPGKSYLEEFIGEQRSKVEVLGKRLLAMYNCRLDVDRKLGEAASGKGLLASALPVGSGLNPRMIQIEDGASKVLGNFKKQFSLNASPVVQRLVITRLLAFVFFNI